MKYEMVMPKMGESITEGTILKWLKKEGDTIEKDEIILEISTDKVDSEIPTPVPGVLLKFLVAENETVEVGKPIAIIETEAVEAKPPAAASVESETSKPEPAAATPAPVKQDQPKPQPGRFYSPVVMKIAAEEQIPMSELDAIPGSGRNGRLTKKDVLSYLNSRQQSAAEFTFVQPQAIPAGEGNVEVIPMDNMRKRIAEHMIASKQTSAHVNLYTEVDMHAVTRVREKNKDAFRKREGFGLTYTAFIVEAVVNALKEFPMLNASLDGDRILIKKDYHIGVAVAVDNGLVVPNIFNAGEKSLTGLARAVNDLAVRARARKLLPDEMANGTFSISNFGVYGTTIGFPIINQPQVAILGVGAIKKRPVVINNAIAIRPIMYLALTIDHRLIDGAMGSQFLERIRELLENYDPEMNV